MKSTIIVAAAALALGAWALTGCEEKEGQRQPGQTQQPETGTRERMGAPTTRPGRMGTETTPPTTQPGQMRTEMPTTRPGAGEDR